MTNENYTYDLGENDYHTHLLYTISKSSSAIKTRAKIRLMMTLFLLIFAVMSFLKKAPGQSIYFIVLATASYLFMPRYTRWSYSKTYLKHVRKFYKDRMSEITSIQLNENGFLISDSQGESEILYSEITQINELSQYCFLKLKSGQSIILPTYKIEDSENLLVQLTSISQKNKIEWNDETEWSWK